MFQTTCQASRRSALPSSARSKDLGTGLSTTEKQRPPIPFSVLSRDLESEGAVLTH